MAELKSNPDWTDYENSIMPEDLKNMATKDWDEPTTATPIKDLMAVKDAIENRGTPYEDILDSEFIS